MCDLGIIIEEKWGTLGMGLENLCHAITEERLFVTGAVQLVGRLVGVPEVDDRLCRERNIPPMVVAAAPGGFSPHPIAVVKVVQGRLQHILRSVRGQQLKANSLQCAPRETETGRNSRRTHDHVACAKAWPSRNPIFLLGASLTEQTVSIALTHRNSPQLR